MDKLELKRIELKAERSAAYHLLKKNVRESAAESMLQLLSAGIAELNRVDKAFESTEGTKEKEHSNIDLVISGLNLIKELI